MVLRFNQLSGSIIEYPSCGCKCSVTIEGDVATVEMTSRCSKHSSSPKKTSEVKE